MRKEHNSNNKLIISVATIIVASAAAVTVAAAVAINELCKSLQRFNDQLSEGFRNDEQEEMTDSSIEPKVEIDIIDEE